MKYNNPYNHPLLKGFKAKTGTLDEKLAYMHKMKENPENIKKLKIKRQRIVNSF